MSTNDILSDTIARLRNGQRANLQQVRCQASRVVEAVLKVLKDEGYIQDYNRQQVAKGRDEMLVTLKYHEGEAVIRSIRRISSPGRRVYNKIAELMQVRNGLGISIISTSKGVLSDHEARRAGVGGEVICEVY